MGCFWLYSVANYLSLETYCVRLIFAVLSVQEGMIVLLIYFNTVYSLFIYYFFTGLIYWIFVVLGTVLVTGGKKMRRRYCRPKGPVERDSHSARCVARLGRSIGCCLKPSQPRWAISVAGGSEEGGGAVGLDFSEEATTKDDIGNTQWRWRRWGGEWEENVPRPRSKTIQLILVGLNEDILARAQVF